METRTKIILAVVGVAVLSIIYYFVAWWEPSLTEGEITSISKTADVITYRQEQHSVYRTVTKYHWVLRSYSDGKKTRTRNAYEPYSDQEFDHYEYSIIKDFNGADNIVTIQAPASKHPDTILTAKIYVSPDRIKDLQQGEMFYFDKKLGDVRSDTNNSSTEVAQQAYNSFDLDSWVVQHDPKYNTTGAW